jgi:hypothetical protein
MRIPFGIYLFYNYVLIHGPFSLPPRPSLDPAQEQHSEEATYKDDGDLVIW